MCVPGRRLVTMLEKPRYRLPVIGSERRSWNAFLVVKIGTGRVHRVGISHGHRIGDVR